MDKKSNVIPLLPFLGEPSPEELRLHTQRVQERKSARAEAKKRLKAIKRKIRGKQYSLKIRVRATPRVIAFKPRTTEEEGHNSETGSWSTDAIKRLHYVLLLDSFMTLKSLGELESSRAAEIILWIKSEGEGPFSFNACVRIASELSQSLTSMPYLNADSDIDFAGVDPDTLRSLALRLVRSAYGELPDFEGRIVEGLTAAASGDTDAMDWCLSEDKGPFSFGACCDALGFTPEECLALIPKIKVSRATESESVRVAR